jgi:hypothetical protein
MNGVFMPNNYINNEEFLNALIERKKQIKEAEELGKPKPKVSNYIGECILKIANGLSHKSNFINYSFRDDMVLDGVITCLQYIDNFDPERYSNPFAYYTQIIFFSFLRKIKKEKRQYYIRNKLIQDTEFETFSTSEHDEDKEYKNVYVDFLQNNTYVEDEPVKPSKKKKSAPLEEFME